MFVWINKATVLASAIDPKRFFAHGEVVPREHLASPERIKALIGAGALEDKTEKSEEPKPVDKPKRKGRPKKGKK
jgi:hypothetical protein